MSIVKVQSGTPVASQGSRTGNSLTIAGVTQHNTLIALVSHEDTSGTAGQSVTLSDGQGTYTPDITVTRGNQVWIGLYSLWDCVAGSHVLTPVSAVGTPANSAFYYNVLEFSGLGTTNTFDSGFSNSATANTSATPAVTSLSTLANINSLVIAGLTSNSNITGRTVPPTGGNNSPFLSIYTANSFMGNGSGISGSCDSDYQINTTVNNAVTASWGTDSLASIWAALVGAYGAASVANIPIGQICT